MDNYVNCVWSWSGILRTAGYAYDLNKHIYLAFLDNDPDIKKDFNPSDRARSNSKWPSNLLDGIYEYSWFYSI